MAARASVKEKNFVCLLWVARARSRSCQITISVYLSRPRSNLKARYSPRQINLVGLKHPRGGRYGDCIRQNGACAIVRSAMGCDSAAVAHRGMGDERLAGSLRARLSLELDGFSGNDEYLPRCCRTWFAAPRLKPLACNILTLTSQFMAARGKQALRRVSGVVERVTAGALPTPLPRAIVRAGNKDTAECPTATRVA
jgi:hypothetical protein